MDGCYPLEGREMKVKDVIRQLEVLDPEEDIVMKNLFANSFEDPYVLTQVRVYKYKGKVYIDGYSKKLV